MVERTARVLSNIGYTPYVRETRTAKRVVVCSRILSRAFEKWFGRNAKSKRIPDFILYHRDHRILKAFLRGYIDGDGSYDKHGGYWLTPTVSKVLALQLQLLSARLNVPALIHECMPSEKASIIEGRRVKVSVQYRVCIYLNGYRRWNNQVKDVGKYFITPVKSVERVPYTGRVYNLETSDETYLVNNVVVHNCNTKWNIHILEARRGIERGCLPKDIRFALMMDESARILRAAIEADEAYKRWLSTAS